MKPITHREIDKALQLFQKRGGIVTYLPDQIVKRSPQVNSQYEEPYERIYTTEFNLRIDWSIFLNRD